MHGLAQKPIDLRFAQHTFASARSTSTRQMSNGVFLRCTALTAAEQQPYASTAHKSSIPLASRDEMPVCKQRAGAGAGHACPPNPDHTRGAKPARATYGRQPRRLLQLYRVRPATAEEHSRAHPRDTQGICWTTRQVRGPVQRSPTYESLRSSSSVFSRALWPVSTSSTWRRSQIRQVQRRPKHQWLQNWCARTSRPCGKSGRLEKSCR